MFNENYMYTMYVAGHGGCELHVEENFLNKKPTLTKQQTNTPDYRLDTEMYQCVDILNYNKKGLRRENDMVTLYTVNIVSMEYYTCTCE